MNTIFFGTPTPAAKTLTALLATPATATIDLVCTRPPSRIGRGRRREPTPVATIAAQHGIPTYTPNRLDADAIDRLKAIAADVYIVVAYGRFIPDALLDHPRHGIVNIHPSLLPRHRGPSPVTTAILDGDATTGTTVMRLDAGMDTGPVLAQSDPVPITPDTRADELTARLFDLGATMLPDVLERLAAGMVTPQPQDERLATVSRLIRKEDGVVDWHQPADRIVRMNRAYHPWPGTSTTWNGDSLKLVDVDAAPATNDNADADTAAPGTVYRSPHGSIDVRAGDGTSVRIVTLQAPGRRALPARDFVAGRPELIGARLGV